MQLPCSRLYRLQVILRGNGGNELPTDEQDRRLRGWWHVRRGRNCQAASHPASHLPPCASPDHKVCLHIKHSTASIYSLWTASGIQGGRAWGVGAEGGNNFPPRTWIQWYLHSSSAINIAESSREQDTTPSLSLSSTSQPSLPHAVPLC